MTQLMERTRKISLLRPPFHPFRACRSLWIENRLGKIEGSAPLRLRSRSTLDLPFLPDRADGATPRPDQAPQSGPFHPQGRSTAGLFAPNEVPPFPAWQIAVSWVYSMLLLPLKH